MLHRRNHKKPSYTPHWLPGEQVQTETTQQPTLTDDKRPATRQEQSNKHDDAATALGSTYHEIASMQTRHEQQKSDYYKTDKNQSL